MAACSPVAAAVGAALRPVLWSHIPFHVPYPLGLALQERLVARRFEARAQLAELPAPGPASRVADAVAPSSGSSSSSSSSSSAAALQRVSETDVLLLLEHTPVYTEGRRKGAREAVGDDAERVRLERLGAHYLVTQRGGQITYHGPGQLVGYPIWDLAAMQLSTRCYVDKLQTAIAELLHARPFSLQTVPPPDDHTGVWSDSDHKITSIGIQVRHRITSHGFALNVEAERLLPWFRQIVACGIEGKGMTTLERELALAAQRAGLVSPDAAGGVQLEPGLQLLPNQRVTVADIAPAVAHQLGATYNRAVEPAPEAELRYEGNADGVLTRVWVAGEEVVAAPL